MGILTNVVIPPWFRIAAIGMVLAAAGSAGFYLGYALERGRWDREKVKLNEAHEAAIKAMIADFHQQHDADSALLTQASTDLEQIRNERDELQTAIAKLPQKVFVTTTEVPSNGPTCPDRRLSDSFRVCWNAAASGDRQAAAACQAGGVPDAGAGGRVPVTVDVSKPHP